MIVSLTSYPPRIPFVCESIKSILNQTVKAEKIILWLAKQQFPSGLHGLPEELLNMRQSGDIEIRWCDELGPHKKYFYSLQEFSGCPVTIVDDDIKYNSEMLQKLMQGYERNKNCISAFRVHRMKIGKQNRMAPSKQWMTQPKRVKNFEADIALLGNGGVLIPPNIMPQVTFRKEEILKRCKYADDLWLKACQVYAGIPVQRVSAKGFYFEAVKGSQNVALWNQNKQDGNDIQWSLISDFFNSYSNYHGTGEWIAWKMNRWYEQQDRR